MLLFSNHMIHITFIQVSKKHDSGVQYLFLHRVQQVQLVQVLHALQVVHQVQLVLSLLGLQMDQKVQQVLVHHVLRGDLVFQPVQVLLFDRLHQQDLVLLVLQLDQKDPEIRYSLSRMRLRCFIQHYVHYF